jgi:hypothetical protein
MIVIAVTVAVGTFSLSVRSTTAQDQRFQAPRLGKTKVPNLSGIWQTMNTANWDLLAHNARPALAVERGPGGFVPAAPVLSLGAIGGVPGGLGVVDGNEIPYQPAAAAKQRENFETVLTRDPEVKCYMPGVPRAMYMPYPFQILQSTDRIVMVFEYATAVRVIELENKAPALEDSWMGHSVGRWEGDTLVVDVTNQVENTWFDRAGNFHSGDMTLVERFTLTDRNTLDYQVTVTDPAVFTRPWRIRMPIYRRLEPNMQLSEFKCVEFVEELMYGHLRKEQLVRNWEGGTLSVNITRKVPPPDERYLR